MVLQRDSERMDYALWGAKIDSSLASHQFKEAQTTRRLFGMFLINDGRVVQAPDPNNADHKNWFDLYRTYKENMLGLTVLESPMYSNPEQSDKIKAMNFCEDIVDRILPDANLRIYQPEGRKFNAQELEVLKTFFMQAHTKATRETPLLIIPGNSPGPYTETCKSFFDRCVLPYLNKEKGHVILLLFYEAHRDGISAEKAREQYGEELNEYFQAASEEKNRAMGAICLNDQTSPNQSINSLMEDPLNKARLEYLRNILFESS